ncbi:hypothetical protein J4T99_gp068 [Mycobacterium phage Bromden]|uniref:Lipoprotein n=1 Tax=Mycobacterium phage Bromden TaxID=2283252 RepID=A0A345MBQ2_9CAUD|nr:hypothetical protein J4T99_gp068 [Mycobacterium phage Bromden]AXH67923.1 hypothetical protein SEA_BROMDEN_68 [Mycobacterium phage Bromden]
MSKSLRALLVAGGIALALTGCQPSAENGVSTDPGAVDPGGSGLVISPRSGGIGFDMGGGMYLDPATGQIGFGGLPLG